MAEKEEQQQPGEINWNDEELFAATVGEGAAVYSPTNVKTVRDLIRQGVPKRRFLALSKALGVRPAELAEVVAVPVRTLQRRSVFTPTESDRIVQIEGVLAHAINVLGSLVRARTWINAPKRALEGRTPLQYCDTSFGVQEVHHLLGRIDHSVIG